MQKIEKERQKQLSLVLPLNKEQYFKFKIEKFEILKQKFDQRLKLCNLFKKLVLEATANMRVSE